jgi:drug/metabolite transporter (DMT)-like permease
LYQRGEELDCFRVVGVRWPVLTKLCLLVGYASGSALCIGSALVIVGFLYNETSLFKSTVVLTYALVATAGGIYLYFRMLKLLSPKRRIRSYPVNHRPNR